MATEPLDPPASYTPPLTVVRLVPLDAIHVPPRRLRGRAEADGLRESIAANGLLQPLLLDQSLALVCGLHRLEACRALGWREVPAIVQAWSEVEARLAEIDENLCRRELDVLERAEHIALRKKLWNQLRATREAAAPADATKKRAGRTKAPSRREEMEALAAFVDDTARRAGRVKSAVREEIRIGELPEEVRELARDTPLTHNRRELLALTRMPAEEQREALERVRAGEAKTVRKPSARAAGGASATAREDGSAPGADPRSSWNALRAIMDTGGPSVVQMVDREDPAAVRGALADALEQACHGLDRAIDLWPADDADLTEGDDGMPGTDVLRQAASAIRRLADRARRHTAR